MNGTRLAGIKGKQESSESPRLTWLLALGSTSLLLGPSQGWLKGTLTAACCSATSGPSLEG